MKHLIALLLLAVVPVFASAQDESIPENDQIRARRGAYITERLQLTSQEAAHFWTLFNEFEEQKKAINSNFRRSVTRPQTEEEAQELIQRSLQKEQDLLDLKKEYFLRLQEKVPARKLVMIPQAEREFRRDLLRQLRRRQGGN
ncbi:MAG: hypothetical protein AAFZ63_09405 [Bacteroidota bacterium]